MKNRTRKAILNLLVFAAVFLQLSFAGEITASEPGQQVYHKNSLYHSIFVYQQGPIVSLQFGKRPGEPIQSRVNLSNLRQHQLEYTKMAFCGLFYNPEPKKVLVLGLGGGVIPREIRHYFPAAEVNVVEIDPEISAVATQYFNFRPDDKLKVNIDDGRLFIREQLRLDPVPKYDLIILDAFNGDYIPFHLMTREFLQEVKGVLADDGVVVANVFHDNRLFDAELATYLDVFGRCQAFFGFFSTNAMLVALGADVSELTIDQAVSRAQILQRRHRFEFNIQSIALRLEPDIRPDSKVKVLTDDRAPVNRLRTQRRR